MTKPEFELSIDCRKTFCPIPILETKKAIMTLNVGQVLEMVATDPGSVSDMKGWSRSTGHELLQHDKNGEEFFFYVRKTH